MEIEISIMYSQLKKIISFTFLEGVFPLSSTDKSKSSKPGIEPGVEPGRGEVLTSTLSSGPIPGITDWTSSKIFFFGFHSELIEVKI